MARRKWKGDKDRRDGSGFVAIPNAVLDSAAYRNLSAYGAKLLLDLARQFNGKNNGRITCLRADLLDCGWNSPNTIQKAREELIANGLLWESRKGAMPNKEAWYALTWRALDLGDGDGMDHSTKSFPRGAYRHVEPIVREKRAVAQKATGKTSALVHGVYLERAA